MKIVYFYQYFSTPKGSWGTRVYDFASEWVKKGHEVTVVSSIYSKSDIHAEGFIEDQEIDGINVKILNIKIDNKQSFFRRVWSFLQYAFISTWYAITLPADVVIASSGPITVGLPGLAAHYLRGRKLVFEARDLWPQGAIELGIIKNNFVKKVAYWFEKQCYKASSLIVALSPGMKKYIEDKHSHENVISVTNAANIKLFSEKRKLNGTHELKPKKYAIYTGNIGEVNNSWWLLHAAELLLKKGRRDIKIVLIGEGQQREELEKAARENNVSNFKRLGLMPKSDLIPFVQNALVSLVPLKGTPILDTSSPNKFFESLAAGVPVIQNTNGWMKKFLADNQIGFTIDPDKPDQLADLLIELDSDTESVSGMGERAARIAQQQFDKVYLAEKMLDGIKKIKG